MADDRRMLAVSHEVAVTLPWRILLVDRDAALAEALAAQFGLAREFTLLHARDPGEAEPHLPAADLVLAEPDLAPLFGSIPVLPIAKPLRLAPLLAAMREALARREAAAVPEFAIGAYAFRPTERLLAGEGRPSLRLTEKEAQILAYLCRSRGEIVARETLLAEVWGYREGVTTHTLETHVYRLRRKIETEAGGERLLVTEPGGYRLAP